ncbi:metallophosphoesterase [Erwinia sp. 198]|uniref:metallophosphoesterase n=1 Tax=Erwinia sp. 198 TaxID=2022746 RepID=UPI000F67FA93|nr:metallophosphoesterase [Erwinia sp. 198]RRZ92919.1 hypothetical protein EGK14_09355 [Erwinia sp. 198]
MNIKSIVITSDPQYPWTDVTDDGGYEDSSTQRQRSYDLISRQYNSINEYHQYEGIDTRIIINGDITAYGHKWQRDVMNLLMGTLQAPYCYGLGNHDIENNYNDTWQNQAAIGAMHEFYTHYMTRSLPNKRWDAARHLFEQTFTGSFSYSWDEGEHLHFIQLNNFPGMTNYDFPRAPSESGVNDWMKLSMYLRADNQINWLENDLRMASSQGRNIFINVHKPNSWPDAFKIQIERLIKEYEVKAVFAGHYHKTHGFNRSFTNYLGGAVPVFLSGSASQQTYLITECSEKEMTIFLVKENNWRNKERIYTIPLKERKAPADRSTVNILLSGSHAQTIAPSEFNPRLIVKPLDIQDNKQKFTLLKSPEKGFNVFQIKELHSNNIIAWHDNGGGYIISHPNEFKEEHYWCFNYQPDGTYEIANFKNRNLVMQATIGNGNLGTYITLNDRHNTAGQRFNVEETAIASRVRIGVVDRTVIQGITRRSDVAYLTLDWLKNAEEMIFIVLPAPHKGNNVVQLLDTSLNMAMCCEHASGWVIMEKNSRQAGSFWCIEDDKFALFPGEMKLVSYKFPDLVLTVSDSLNGGFPKLNLQSRREGPFQSFKFLPSA